MAGVLFTTTQAIRAALGVGSVSVAGTLEVPDSMLLDQGLDLQMRTSLYSLVPDYQARYAAGVTGGATAEQVYIKDLLTLYCLYFGAIRLLEMVIALRRKATDGKQGVERFDIDWEALMQALKDRLSKVEDDLAEVLSPNDGGPNYFSRVIPDYDPVTNL